MIAIGVRWLSCGQNTEDRLLNVESMFDENFNGVTVTLPVFNDKNPFIEL